MLCAPLRPQCFWPWSSVVRRTQDVCRVVLTLLLRCLFQNFSFTGSRLPLNLLLLTTIAVPHTRQSLLATLQGCLTRLQQRAPTGDGFRRLLLGSCDIETEFASTITCTPLILVKSVLPPILSLLPLIRDGVAFVGGSFPLVGLRFTCVGGSFPLVRDDFAFVGGSLARVEYVLPPL